jgi:hypothetical protein
VAPLVVANGLGVNSQAVLSELHRRGERPDAILFADGHDTPALVGRTSFTAGTSNAPCTVMPGGVMLCIEVRGVSVSPLVCPMLIVVFCTVLCRDVLCWHVGAYQFHHWYVQCSK